MSDVETPGDDFAGQVVDLDQAVAIELPDHDQELRPRPFTAADGRRGWSVRLPESRPLATPAYEDGRLFVGGGYGSYAFYAFDAGSGAMLWQMRTADDGPTAAVVERGLVAFNTESCTVVVCEAGTGRLVWDEWLGDPLMSQPAIAGDRLFIAYPADQRKPLLRPGMSLEQKRKAIGEAKAAPRSGRHEHRMLCANLHTGEHLWEQRISGDVLTAPVVDGAELFFTCLDGVSCCLRIDDGSIIWEQAIGATSAPLVVGGRVVLTEKQMRAGRASQGMRRWHRHSGAASDRRSFSSKRADWLSAERGGGSSIKHEHASDLDASVGFASAPASAKLEAATAHLGVSSVSGAWAYQGARAAYAHGRIYHSQGRYVTCVLDHEDSPTAWESSVKSQRIDPDDQALLPPALGRQHVYFTGTAGHVMSVDPESGQVAMLYDTHRPIPFQPCLAEGRIYFGTSDGELVCLEAGDDAHGWPMWGGNAQHNKVVGAPVAG